MTSTDFFSALVSIVSDLPQEMPAEHRYKRLLDALQQSFPCDAACILRLDGHILEPLAIAGLSDDTMGRHFVVEEHPRLANLLHSREPVRFPSDSELPDPYDGLVETSDHLLHVHDCMGASLYIDNQPWGVLTLDATLPGTFDKIDPIEFRAFISLTEATIKATHRIEALEARVIKEQQVAQSLVEGHRKNEIMGNSPTIKRLKNEIKTVAQSYLTVLILGETGVGKELVARQLQTQSSRGGQPLVYINCAALPEGIAESELFGHVKGAFSGATTNRSGKFELADDGTLFLDEIGELSLTIQAKLLRALQSGEIQRVGSDRHIEVDVRIIAATNRDLKEEVAKGRFRADLYHRLSVYPIYVPPLRERGNDVLLLAGHLLEINQRRFGVKGLRLAPDAKQMLLHYNWPGNVRELEHLLSRASLKAIMDQGRDSRTVIIEPQYLDIDGQKIPEKSNTSATTPQPSMIPDRNITLKNAVDQFQQELIADRLQTHNGNLAAVARDLDINRSNLYRLLKRLSL
ncbi:MAG: nitric oxide reductase transcriptional regulator NorR [Porticoccaceae bacterium]|nr:MAG: nitric oxide reductase transcriptional regulator NorR [Porticoccaceae bacterium]